MFVVSGSILEHLKIMPMEGFVLEDTVLVICRKQRSTVFLLQPVLSSVFIQPGFDSSCFAGNSNNKGKSSDIWQLTMNVNKWHGGLLNNDIIFSVFDQSFVPSQSSNTYGHERCQTFCRGYDNIKYYAMTTYNGNGACKCGEKLLPTTFARPQSECNTPCPGHPSEVCGGESRHTIKLLP